MNDALDALHAAREQVRLLEADHARLRKLNAELVEAASRYLNEEYQDAYDNIGEHGAYGRLIKERDTFRAAVAEAKEAE